MMNSFLIMIAVLAIGALALWRAAFVKARWEMRAHMAEQENREVKKAHDIQNRVAADPAFRERGRRLFDRP